MGSILILNPWSLGWYMLKPNVTATLGFDRCDPDLAVRCFRWSSAAAPSLTFCEMIAGPTSPHSRNSLPHPEPVAQGSYFYCASRQPSTSSIYTSHFHLLSLALNSFTHVHWISLPFTPFQSLSLRVPIFHSLSFTAFHSRTFTPFLSLLHSLMTISVHYLASHHISAHHLHIVHSSAMIPLPSIFASTSYKHKSFRAIRSFCTLARPAQVAGQALPLMCFVFIQSNVIDSIDSLLIVPFF